MADLTAERLPTGTVTFLFTDVEGSTRLLHELGAEAYAQALAEHRRLLRGAFTRNAGVEVDTQGDAFFVAFPTAQGALEAAREATEGLADGPIRVRIGIHTGTPVNTPEGYVGPDVHRAARIAAAGHGGQVLVSAATAALLGSDGLRDLGEHRLKDLAAPERIFQAGEPEFPPLKSLHATNLPVPATPFLGREREVGEVSALLRRDDVRVVTMTGPGGTGKTRLALQSAGAVGDAFEGGTWWVPLAPIRDPQLVLPTAARALGAQGDLAEHIGDKRMLLLFDNFEQVTAAGANVARLLERCPRLKVVVTSREPLHIAGEWEYGVDPLREAEAVELFMTRALAARRDFSANGEVRQICLRLDNLPLAIELAAARVKLLSPRALLERLEQRLPVLTGGARDAPERQRTLRATIEWSHELLPDDEQRLFARLAVFRGGWTLQAAEQVVDAELDTLQSLVDKSLVRQRDDRFSMLETIREYAGERLEASGEADEIRRRHAEFFLALAESGGSHIAARPDVWLDPLEREHDNFRAALDSLADAGDPAVKVRLAGALWSFWYIRGYMAEGRRRLEEVIAASPQRTLARAHVLNGATAMALECGDAATARTRADEALAINRELGHAWGIADSKFLLGQVVREEGNLAEARLLFDETAHLFRELGDVHFELLATAVSAWVSLLLGEADRSRTLNEAVLKRARETGNVRMEAQALVNLAEVATADGEIEQAVSLLAEAYGNQRQLGARNDIAQTLTRLAAALASRAPAQAARLLGSAAALFSETGASGQWVVAMNAETLATVRIHLDEATLAEAIEEGRSLTADDAVALALGETRTGA